MWLFLSRIALGECGNGIVEPGEGCDDGNDVTNDGCSAGCMVEGACYFECRLSRADLVPGGPTVQVPAAVANLSDQTCDSIVLARDPPDLDIELTNETSFPTPATPVLPGGTFDFTMDLSALGSSDATESTPHSFNYSNDGSDWCYQRRSACLIPERELTSAGDWSIIPGYATAYSWNVTVEADTAQFQDRTVREFFDAGEGVDSCWFVGSYYAESTRPNPAVTAEWQIDSSNMYIPIQTGAPGADNVGPAESWVLWYRGDQANMTTDQVNWINAGNPAPPLLIGTDSCGFV